MGAMSRLPDAHPSPGSIRRLLLTEPRRPAAIRESRRAHWYVVGTVCVGAFMGQLDASIVTLALPRLGRDLHASVGAVEWVALAYLLVLVATVATVGRIADAVGRKLLYVYGFGVFTAGSVLCGLAPTLAVLIAARVLQAVGAAMLQANSVALITEAMPRPLLGRGIGVQGTAQALGLALGPVVGGALLALGGWRLIFLVNLPAGVIGLALGWFLLPRSRSRREGGGGDQLGALLLAVGAAGPLIYLSLADRAGYGDPLLLSALVAGLLAAVGFVRRERRVDAPLIDLSILRRGALSVGLSSGLVSYLVLFGTLFVVPYYLTAEHVGFALVGLQLSVLPVAIGIAAPIAGRLLNRVGDRPLTGGGMILTGVGLLEIALWHWHRRAAGGPRARRARARRFHPREQRHDHGRLTARPRGVVSGVLNMTRGMGTAVGVALASAIYIAAAGASSTRVAPAAAAHGLTAALAVLGSVALAGGLSLLLSRRRANAGASSRWHERARPLPYPARLHEPDPARAASSSRAGQ